MVDGEGGGAGEAIHAHDKAEKHQLYILIYIHIRASACVTMAWWSFGSWMLPVGNWHFGPLRMLMARFGPLSVERLRPKVGARTTKKQNPAKCGNFWALYEATPAHAPAAARTSAASDLGDPNPFLQQPEVRSAA